MAFKSHTKEEPFVTNDEICQKLVEEFVEMTKSDSALAQFYLQDRNWNLRLSVNDYFEEINKQSKHEKPLKRKLEPIDISTDESDCDVVFDLNSSLNSKKSGNSSKADSTVDSKPMIGTDVKEFRFICWNIDGIDEKNLRIRTESVAKYIRNEKALIVFLQEVVPQSEKILRESLPEYELLSGNNNSVDYYVLTLIHKSYVKLETNDIIEFPNTSMGRNLLKTRVKIGGALVCLLNTHLESTKDFSAVRISQLNRVFRYIPKIPDEETVIFGGDLNIRDNEVTKTEGIPKGVYDVWIKTGARKELEYTWDQLRNDNLQFMGRSNFKPRLRFDRIFVRPSNPSKIEANHFGLIGLQRLKPHVCFPSDHWGLRVHFDIS